MSKEKSDRFCHPSSVSTKVTRYGVLAIRVVISKGLIQWKTVHSLLLSTPYWSWMLPTVSLCICCFHCACSVSIRGCQIIEYTTACCCSCSSIAKLGVTVRVLAGFVVKCMHACMSRGHICKVPSFFLPLPKVHKDTDTLAPAVYNIRSSYLILLTGSHVCIPLS
jgi:hypothetical protein